MIADLPVPSSLRILLLASIPALCSCDTDSAPPVKPSGEPAASSEIERSDAEAYPLELPGWYEELRAKLDHPVDVSFPRVSLAEALRGLQVLTDVAMGVDESAQDAISAPIELSPVVGLSLETVLRLLLLQANGEPRLEIHPAPAGLVVTRKSGDYPQPGAAGIREKLESLRRRRARAETKSEESVPEPTRRLENRLRATRLTASFDDRPLVEVVEFLRQVVGVEIGIDPDLDASAMTVSISAKDEPAIEVLDRILESEGLGRIHRDGILFILDEEKEKDHRIAKGMEMLGRLDSLQKIRPLLKKKLDPSFEGATVRTASVALGKALGVPVHLDPEAWRSEVRITDLGSPTDLREIAEILESRGLRMVVARDAVYIVTSYRPATSP